MSEGELVFCILAWKLRSPVLPLLPPFFLPLPFPAAAERLFICVPHPKWCGPLWLSFQRQLVFIGLPRGIFGVGLFYVVWCPTRGTDKRQQHFARSGLWAGCGTAEPGPRRTQESLHWFHQPLAHCFHPAKFINRHCACLLGSKRRPWWLLATFEWKQHLQLFIIMCWDSWLQIPMLRWHWLTTLTCRLSSVPVPWPSVQGSAGVWLHLSRAGHGPVRAQPSTDLLERSRARTC